jgi:23S rRNA pseudouridine2605 synthase
VLLAQGRVTVDGAVASVGDRIEPDNAVVAIDGVVLPLDPTLATWLIYKPVGVVSTMDDPQGRPTVRAIVPREPVTNPVGRLDLHSEGLMLMTNDGDLALRVTHPRYAIGKTYHVLVPGHVTNDDVKRLVTGIELDDGHAAARSCRVISKSAGRVVVELVMAEGRKREIRRMFDALGIPIDRLVRTAIGGLVDRSLKPGSYRELSVDEIRALYKLASKAGTDD